MNSDPLRRLVEHQNAGESTGVYSICSSNRYVIEAALLQAKADRSAILIEPTVNQVNQFGGYTGMTPGQFVSKIQKIAEQMEFPFDHIILGGDHLGPNPWKHETADSAMSKSGVLVKDYVEKGFQKVHLDTSIRCADDAGDPTVPMDDTIVAERAARLCQIAEETYQRSPNRKTPPVYVIGTEVPIPGGATEKQDEIVPTTIDSIRNTIEITKQAFLSRGLESAWDRVIAAVVQPGVEFGDSSVHEYNRNKTTELVGFIEQMKGMVFEAHSTDYQTEVHLRELVKDHFAILKVGPWLTFAFREAIFALAMMEEEWLGQRKGVTISQLRQVLDQVMLENTRYWQNHYQGNDYEKQLARKYSYSDRSRYYWQNNHVQISLEQLFNNLSAYKLPHTLLSQFLPNQYEAIRTGSLTGMPEELVYHKILEVTQKYSRATQFKELFR